MFSERRHQARRVVNRIAQFYREIGELRRPCMVTDLSESGARLYSETEMPDQFILALSGEGVAKHRACRVMWRLGGELGVAFVEPAR